MLEGCQLDRPGHFFTDGFKGQTVFQAIGTKLYPYLLGAYAVLTLRETPVLGEIDLSSLTPQRDNKD